jgi:hypothetical protein
MRDTQKVRVSGHRHADAGVAQAADDGKSLKQKARERMQPKLGKIDIDYQVLHDAFFRYQTKPDMSGHGQQYYEGKEMELKVSTFKPGASAAPQTSCVRCSPAVQVRSARSWQRRSE